jgi:hypothetical protein
MEPESEIEIEPTTDNEPVQDTRLADAVNFALDNNAVKFNELVLDVVRDKLADRFEARRIEIAQDLLGPEGE